ncbi:MAG: hypothetical protein Q8R83_01425 [Legionellaceae bacterium]|nr:hypothetical protein [Legionellaceae bacterium]
MNMDVWFKKTFLFLVVFFCVNPLFAGNWVDYAQFMRKHFDLYLPLSGGYGYLQHAEYKTGFSGVLRFGLGSRWRVNDTLQLGTELGFQTGESMLMNAETTEVLGPNALPVSLTIKPPIDFLLTVKYDIYKPVFAELKGGVAYLNTMVSGADMLTSQVWLPEIQAGMGMRFSSNIALVVSYQRFFGQNPKVINLNLLSGISTLRGIPTWQALLLTAEIRI